MKLNQKLNRREFLAYFFSAFIFVFLIKYNFKKQQLDLDEKLYKKINKYNFSRTTRSNEDYKIYIKKDHEQNRTVWIGKRLYTYAELNK